MSSKSNFLMFIMLLSFSLISPAAVEISECEDELGQKSFHKNCPPGTTKVGGKTLSTGTGGNATEKQAVTSAVLYVVPECDTCDEVREFLQARNIQISEKNVNDDVKLQKELTDLVGALKVPVTVINEEVVVGYNRSQLNEIVSSSGEKE